MKKFELCFSLDEETLLLPDLLDVEEPEFHFDEQNVLHFLFEYDFLPKSVMPRLIINLHTDILDSLCWRTGVVLNDKSFGAKAVIREDERDKKISVSVAGHEKREYFSIIWKTFLDIHQKFQGLKVREKVPCICSQCRRQIGKPHYFDYRYLLQRRRKGKKTVDCQLSIEDVSLDALFDGLESTQSAPFDGWDVFISYATKDVAIVTDIVRDLKDHQVRCWWDYEQIDPGDSISKKIELGLRKSRFVMPIISTNQVKSGWSRAEYASILHKSISGQTSQKVTPLIIDNLPEDEIPLLLQDFRAEKLSDRRGYERLLTFLSGA
jgi:hypothetical protein